MLILMWSVYTCFGLVSGSLSPISPLLIDKLNLTYTQMGMILGFWQFIYIFTAIPTGTIIDKWKLKKSVLKLDLESFLNQLGDSLKILVLKNVNPSVTTKLMRILAI